MATSAAWGNRGGLLDGANMLIDSSAGAAP